MNGGKTWITRRGVFINHRIMGTAERSEVGAMFIAGSLIRLKNCG
jgi:hypothetical protein